MLTRFSGLLMFPPFALAQVNGHCDLRGRLAVDCGLGLARWHDTYREGRQAMSRVLAPTTTRFGRHSAHPARPRAGGERERTAAPPQWASQKRLQICSRTTDSRQRRRNNADKTNKTCSLRHRRQMCSPPPDLRTPPLPPSFSYHTFLWRRAQAELFLACRKMTDGSDVPTFATDLHQLLLLTPCPRQDWWQSPPR